MSIMIPDFRQHEWMDEMIGEEGSGSLSSMYKCIGYRYLSGDSSLMMGLHNYGRNSSWITGQLERRRGQRDEYRHDAWQDGGWMGVLD